MKGSRSRRSGQRGVRMIYGQEYLLAGRGDHTHASNEAESLKLEWRKVRVVPAGPLGKLLDDWMVYVHDRKG